MNWFIICNQILFYILFRLITPFTKVNFSYNLSVKEFKKGIILAANHPSRLDFLLIFFGMPFRRYVSLLPAHVPTADKYMNTWWKKAIMLSIGCIPIDTYSKKKAAIGLLAIIEKIQDNKTLLMFPEGRAGENNPSKAFSGIGYILLTSNKKFIPVFVEIKKNSQLVPFLMGRQHARIVYGKPYQTPRTSPKEITEFVMKKVYLLS